MDDLIRPLETGDRAAAAALLDDAVGAGFWSFDGPGEELALVAADEGGVHGVLLCRLEPAGEYDAAAPDEAGALPGGRGAAAAPEDRDVPTVEPVLHVRALAVSAERRRQGVARRLLSEGEREAAARGARKAYLFGWLPAGQAEPAAAPFYLAAGYEPSPDIPDFYAAASLASGADCPYCGAPPCRCAARPFTRSIGAR